MKPTATSLHVARRADRRGLATALLAALLIAEVALPGTALAGSSKSSSSEGGRIYNPSRLRDNATGPAPGRAMRRPPIPDPENPRPLHSTAKIPSPEPQPRGGSGYVRKGNKFYFEAQPPQLTRENPNQKIRNSIPNPESPKRGRKSFASR